MKDVPHHMMKFLKKMSKEPLSPETPEEAALVKKELEQPKSKEQIRKQHKLAEKKSRLSHIPSDASPDERDHKRKRKLSLHRLTIRKKERS